MSWKATAFVKELRDNLTVTEKFVLLILAEYHNTQEKATWPSVRTLAYDCLMTERSIHQILARLEEKLFIRRESGCGRSHKTSYQIAGIDYRNPEPQTLNIETGFPQTMFGKPRNPERGRPKPCTAKQRNKEERVEPLKQPVTGICFKCEGKKEIFNYGPGPRIIPCPECQSQVATA